MHIREGKIILNGNEVDDIVRYPISRKFDSYLSDALCADIEQDREYIGEFLESSLKDWEQSPKDYAPDDNVPRELRCFNAFIASSQRPSAREASLILRYAKQDFVENRAVLGLAVPRDFARDIAVASIMHVAVHTEKENEIPITDQSVYEKVQVLPSREMARFAWIKSLNNKNVSKDERDAYWRELNRRDSQEAATQSLANANLLAYVYNFKLSSVVKRSLTMNRGK